MAILKRYSMALIFLLVTVFLMVLATWGVTAFGKKMVAESGGELHPRGESLNK